jgi:hypothetical protein
MLYSVLKLVSYSGGFHDLPGHIFKWTSWFAKSQVQIDFMICQAIDSGWLHDFPNHGFKWS